MESGTTNNGDGDGGGGGGSGGGCLLLSLEPHKAVPAPFLTKTYQLVDDPSTDHIVSWGEDNSTFVVWRPPEFARDLLPNYFKHNNFSSFVRQLNTYGFRKIVPERWEFANEYFRKGEKHLLCEIHRRKTSLSSSSTSVCGAQHSSAHFPFQAYHHSSLTAFPDNRHHLQPSWCDTPPTYVATNGIIPTAYPSSSSPASTTTTSAIASALMEDNERLRRSNAILLSELAHMRKLYNDIIYFVQNHVKPASPSATYPASLLLHLHHQSRGGGNGLQYPKYQGLGCINSGNTTTSSSSLTIAEEPAVPKGDANHSCSSEECPSGKGDGTKLFGVSLGRKRTLHLEEMSSGSTTSITRARFELGKDEGEEDELGHNLMSPSSPPP